MKPPKRPELWVFLALTLAGLAYALLSRRSGEGSAADGRADDAVPAEAALRLHRCVLTRDGRGARLDIALRVRNETAAGIVMQPPGVRLSAAKGRDIPPFYLPFDPRPEIALNSTQDVLARYWIEAADLEGSLVLHVGDRSLEVKSATPLDLGTLPEREGKTFNPGAW